MGGLLLLEEADISEEGRHQMQEFTREFYGTLVKVLLRCWIFGSALLVIWFGAAWLLGDIIHQLHGPMFGITKHELDVMFYGGMGILKLFVFVFFFIPWLSIRLVLNKMRSVVGQAGVEMCENLRSE